MFLEANSALIVVDVQKDFCPGGALAVEDGDAIVKLLNQWMAQAEQVGAVVVASRDEHPPDHCSFEAQGGPWPEHCVAGTDGAAFHDELRLPTGTLIVPKGRSRIFDQYSAFDRTDLAIHLRKLGVNQIWIGGLALEICVKQTVLDAIAQGFDTHLLLEATRAINRRPGDDHRTVMEMAKAGANIEEHAHV